MKLFYKGENMIEVITTCQSNPKIKYKGYNFFKAIYIWIKEWYVYHKYHTMNFCLKFRIR